jgi:hypothetical protein
MFPAVFLALPLLFPVTADTKATRFDMAASAPMITYRPPESFSPPPVPALRYEHESGDVSLTLSPGSPCMGACLKLEGTF